MLVVLDIEIGKTEAEKERAAHEICQCLEVAMSRARREVKHLPHLYKSGIKYVAQSPKACAMLPPKEVHKRGGGDCKQLVLWRIAELREAGVDAKPRIVWLAGKDGLRAHAQLRHPDGSVEDPSFNLGMKQ